MGQTQSKKKTAAGAGREKRWRCLVCGFVMTGEKPPKGCPKCGSSSREFLPDKKYTPLSYDGEKCDVLLINGSTHRSNNTGYMVDLAEDELRAKGISYRRFNLNEYRIDHCWCCYSMKAEYCTYPCRNSEDDMPAFHQMIAASRAVIVASPINWNTMSARLKDFLDRTTCMQNLFHLVKPGLTEGKIVGILVNGHEDGAMKTAMDIYLHFQQMGFVMAPFGIAFRTHGPEFNSSMDAEFFKNDELVISYTKGVVNNVIELMKLDIEGKLKGKLVPVSE
ncbi:MAG: NAD(P)H-dependent oxidoreductase [Methanoregulaceae archaeon]|jgi:multimeric flavodoxin WrbA|nr:NAD(P)H-dependent oxidoreductase [Methanoregulaceae archaeon]MCU0628181.1 NAD(P)H-dependent oxidoreductase [Methanoregulaceae archaeon]